MAKSNNLFTADDFSKDSGKNKTALWIIIAIIVIAAIILAFVFLKKDKPTQTKADEPAQVEQVVNQPAENVRPAALTAPSESAPVAESEQTSAPAPEKEQPTPAPAPKATPAPASTKQYSGDLSILNGKSLEEKANIIIRGIFGNNPDRRNALGDAYQEIQNKVNEMYKNGQVD